MGPRSPRGSADPRASGQRREGDATPSGKLLRAAAGRDTGASPSRLDQAVVLAEGGALGDPLELMRQQRRVGGDHDDDRTLVGVEAAAAGEWRARQRVVAGHQIGNLLTDGDAGDRETRARAIVALHEDTDRVPPTVRGEPSRRRADSALELVADHPGPTADTAFDDGSAACTVQRGERVLFRHVEAVDVVE